jgi:hypothetical protein
MTSKFFFLSLILAFVTPVGAETISPQTLLEAEKYTPIELQSYKQKNYKLDDPAGDFALLKRSELVPKRIMKDLLGKDRDPKDKAPVHEEDYMSEEVLVLAPGSEKSEEPVKKDALERLVDYCKKNSSQAPIFSDLYESLGQDGPDTLEKFIIGLQNVEKPIQGRNNPINREGFSKMFAQVISEEKQNGIEPSYGTPHKWSKEFLAKHGKSSPMLATSKLLMALAVGETNRYMKTDKEAELYKWMTSQKDDSLEVSDVFRESYKMNKGDIYKTLLTIENVMAHQWHNPKREKLPFIKKLKPITSGLQYEQDKFGTWYHLFGIMLYGYVEGGNRAHVIGRVEALGSIILSPTVNKTQKGWMNKQGGLVGGDLSKMVKEKTFTKHDSNKEYLKESSYLNKDEDFRDRIDVPLDSHIVATLATTENDRTFIDIRDQKSRNLKKCTVDFYPNYGKGFDSRIKRTQNDLDLSANGVSLPMFNSSIKKVRGFISCGDSKETLVFETK